MSAERREPSGLPAALAALLAEKRVDDDRQYHDPATIAATLRALLVASERGTRLYEVRLSEWAFLVEAEAARRQR